MKLGFGVVAAIGVGVLLAAAGCGGSPGAGAPVLTLYNGQHEETTKLLVADFTKATGIEVRVRSGEDPELANQILAEGSGSPADVVYTENSAALNLLSEKDRLAKADPTALAAVPARYDSPRGDWVGVAGRAAVLVYNPAKLPAARLPTSILDVGGPSWQGKVGFAPAGADFQAIVSAVVAAEGVPRASEWLRGLARHGASYQSNSAIMQAVNRGELPAGIVYHYYWFRDQAESGANSAHVRLHYFRHRDPGAFLSVSGAGVLSSSKHQREAQQLVRFLTGVRGQTALAKSDDFEYPLNPKVPAHPKLRPLAWLETPAIDPGEIGDGARTVRLLEQANLL